MEDKKPIEPESHEDVEVDDLDVDEPEAESVKGGSGGDYWPTGNIKRAL